MEEPKVIRSHIKVLSRIIWSLALKRFLDFIDFASVITCIWTVFWLIYINFLKDLIDILVYTVFKYANRFRWIYSLFKIGDLLNHIDDFLETYELRYSQEIDDFPPKGTVGNFSGTNMSVNIRAQTQFSRCTPEFTPRSFKNKLYISPRLIDFTKETSSAGENLKDTSVSLEEKAVLIKEKHIPSSPEKNSIFSAEKSVDSNQNVISSLKTNILRAEDNYEPDIVFASPKQQSGLKQKFFSWNFDKIRGSFRKESGSKIPSVYSFKTKCENLASEVTQVQPTRMEDKETLIISSDSPVNVGCCNSMFISFKSKLQMKENAPRLMHYKRF